MAAMPGAPLGDPRSTLRSYRAGAPWRLRDLAQLASAILDRAGVTPVSSAASARPTERTIRFYVAKGLVNPPDGRGTSATYTYRHLLQVLAIKLRQMEGATLDRLATEFRDIPGDVLEHRVASALGPDLPPPSELAPPERAARMASLPDPGVAPTTPRPGTPMRRLVLSPGVELLVADDHPAWDDPAEFARLAARVADALSSARRLPPPEPS